MTEDFNINAEVMEQLRELNRRLSEIAAFQASQPTRADLQAYVLKEVFDLHVKSLEEKDRVQQDELEKLKTSVQSQWARWAQTAGIVVALIVGLITILHTFLPQ
jgi:hypothetical protein